MNIGIILSGGVGSRMGSSTPKQYVCVNRQPILNYCLSTFLHNKRIDSIVVACAEEWKDFIAKCVIELKIDKPVYYAQAGETRQYSIYNALKVADEHSSCNKDIVIIHDAARPLVSDELINRCLDACMTADGVLPVVPVKDTIYVSEDGKSIKSLLDRNSLWNGQAPEAFNLEKYLKAHEEMSHEQILQINGSTELGVKMGLNCTLIQGDPLNFKITTPEDLINFKNILDNRK